MRKSMENDMGLYRKLEESIRSDVMAICSAGMLHAVENVVGG